MNGVDLNVDRKLIWHRRNQVITFASITQEGSKTEKFLIHPLVAIRYNSLLVQDSSLLGSIVPSWACNPETQKRFLSLPMTRMVPIKMSWYSPLSETRFPPM